MIYRLDPFASVSIDTISAISHIQTGIYMFISFISIEGVIADFKQSPTTTIGRSSCENTDCHDILHYTYYGLGPRSEFRLCYQCELQTATCGSLLLQATADYCLLVSYQTDGSSGGVWGTGASPRTGPRRDPSVGLQTSSTQRGPCREREIERRRVSQYRQVLHDIR